MFIHNLVPLLAQAITHIIHIPYFLIATNPLPSVVVGAVQADSLLMETPFQSTGPGPPSEDLSQIFWLGFFAFLNFLKGAKSSSIVSIVRQGYIINM